MTSGRTPRTTSVEQRSIEPIPQGERHGRVRDQFTLWFAANSTALNIFFGGLAVSLGLSLGWAIAAIVIGTVAGAAISAVHAQQGPRLGVPQLVQSRGQFGYYAAVFFFACLIVMEFGFMASQAVIQAFSLHQVFPGPSVSAWLVIVSVPVFVLVFFGHDLVHAWQKLATVALLVSAVVMAVQVFTFHHAAAAKPSAFQLPVFLAVVVVFAVNTAAWAPNISDYSRYLPSSTSFWRGFWAVFLGMVIAVIAFAVLGAKITAMLPGDDLYGAVQKVSGSWALIVMGVSLIGTNAINIYTGALSALSGLATFRKFSFSAAHRIIASLVILAAALLSALLGYHSFLNSFVDFLDVLAFVFFPWSAINMLDFYVLHRGQYDVPSLYTAKGQYGGWLPIPILCYVIGIAVEALFVKQTFYTGPLVSAVGGNDISWILGFIVPLAAYWILSVAFGHRVPGRRPVVTVAERPAPATLEAPTAES